MEVKVHRIVFRLKVEVVHLEMVLPQHTQTQEVNIKQHVVYLPIFN